MFLELSGIDSSALLMEADGASFSRTIHFWRLIANKGKFVLFSLQFSLWFAHHINRVLEHLRVFEGLDSGLVYAEGRLG